MREREREMPIQEFENFYEEEEKKEQKKNRILKS
jgi:hypothetical protein